jgi:hypothetical protein
MNVETIYCCRLDNECSCETYRFVYFMFMSTVIIEKEKATYRPYECYFRLVFVVASVCLGASTRLSCERRCSR